MFSVFHHHGVVLLLAVSGLVVASDQTALVAFMANEKLALAYENVPQVEILMLMSACSIGATMSSLFCDHICAYIGALDCLRVASVFWAACCLGTFCSGTNSQVVLWKLGKGVSLGLCNVSSYLYMFEVLGSADRAACVAWRAVASALGQECLYAVALLLRPRLGPARAFHWVWAAEALGGLFLLVAALLLPQSPAVLSKRGDWAAAHVTHSKLAGPAPAANPRAPNHLRQGWLAALVCSQLGSVLSVLVSPFFWHYVAAFCSLPTPAVELWFHSSYALQVVFSVVPCFFLHGTSRAASTAVGLLISTAAFAFMSAMSFVYSEQTSGVGVLSLSHAVRRLPASTVLALVSVAVSAFSMFVSAALSLYGVESLGPKSRARGLSLAASTAFASGALLNGLLLYFPALRPAVVFAVAAAVLAVSGVAFCFAGDTRRASVQEPIPSPVPPPEELPPAAPASAASPTPPRDSPSPPPFQLEQTQNFVRMEGDSTVPFQLTDAPLVTAKDRLPSERVSLHLSRSASTSTNKEASYSGLWTEEVGL